MEIGHLVGAPEDLVVGNGNGFAHPLGRRAERPRQPLPDDVERDTGRDFSGRLTADAVDDAVHAVIDVDERQVLVVGARAAGIGAERRVQRSRRRYRDVSHDRSGAPGTAARPPPP